MVKWTKALALRSRGCGFDPRCGIKIGIHNLTTKLWLWVGHLTLLAPDLVGGQLQFTLVTSKRYLTSMAKLVKLSSDLHNNRSTGHLQQAIWMRIQGCTVEQPTTRSMQKMHQKKKITWHIQSPSNMEDHRHLNAALTRSWPWTIGSLRH